MVVVTVGGADVEDLVEGLDGVVTEEDTTRVRGEGETRFALCGRRVVAEKLTDPVSKELVAAFTSHFGPHAQRKVGLYLSLKLVLDLAQVLL